MTTTMYLQTATPNGRVHLLPADGSTDGVTLCQRPASTDLGGGRRVAWPAWSPADRGVAPIQRPSCGTCADHARQAVA